MMSEKGSECEEKNIIIDVICIKKYYNTDINKYPPPTPPPFP